jgi:pantoate--beta-alanine ligase
VIETVHVIGLGRVGSAVAARLRERGVAVGGDDPDVVLLCVPDTAIADVARSLARGRAWIGHVSGATPLAALEPHERRFTLHPLQTFDRSGEPRQLDGAWAAISGETEEATAVARELAETLGLRPFELADEQRPLYHAGAVFASNYLVTLERAAIRLGVPAEALVPLMRRTIENGFELTGPIARGDWATVQAHREAILATHPELEHLYETLAGATEMLAWTTPERAPHPGALRMRVVRTVEELREARQELSGDVALVPTMGALHAGHLALLEAARRENDAVVMSLFVNPAQFDDAADFAAYPRDEERDLQLAEEAGVDVVFAPSAAELLPPGHETWVEAEDASSRLEGEARPGHFRGVATICLKLFLLARPTRAYFGQKDAQQVAVVRALVRDLALPLTIRVVPTVRDADGVALSSRNARLSPEERGRAAALPRALRSAVGSSEPAAAARAALNGLDPEYVEVLDLGDAKVLAAAVRVGSTRLIDNVLLEGELR